MLVKPRVHCLENNQRMAPLGQGLPEWESGYWYRFGKKNAEALIGGGIYFHPSQEEPSYSGGIIVSYRIEHEVEFKGRYVFKYLPSIDFVGVSAVTDGWTWRYKKLVL